MRIAISCDSTADLPKEYIEQKNIRIMPLIVNLGEEDYYDGQNISSNEIFEYVDKSGLLPKTAARSQVDYEEMFKEMLKSADAVLHIAFSSTLSSSIDAARKGAEELSNVYIVDSRNLSSGHGLVVMSAVEMLEENKKVEYIISHLEQVIIPKVSTSFIVATMKYLYKGGRCSALAAFGANLLKIKPSIEVKDGKMQVGRKYMGRYSDAVIKYVNDTITAHPSIDKSKIFITYSSKETFSMENIVSILKEKGFKTIYEVNAGSTITSHCGPECVGILFIDN